MSATLTGLLAELRGAPALDGAACTGRGHLFDDRQTEETIGTWRHRASHATSICRSCPVLASCREWLESLAPDRRPHGVVAGLHVDQRGRIQQPTELEHIA